VHIVKASLMLLLTVGILSSCFLICAQAQTNPAVGIKAGDWAKYVGSFPYEEYEWVHVSVSDIEGTKVKISVSFNLRPPYKMSLHPEPGHGYYPSHYQTSQTIDVASGMNNLLLFFIHANSSVGDSIPVPSTYPKLIVNGTDLKEYAGLERTVVYASSSNMPCGGEGIFYWDRETGLLVEILAKIGNSYFSSLRLIETNIWSISLMDWMMRNYVFIALIVVSMAFLMIVSLTLVKRMKTVKWNMKEVHPSRKLIEEPNSPLKQAVESLHHFFRPHLGKMLIGVGLSLLGMGITNFTVFNQVVSSLSFVFAVVFFIIGLLVHTEAWAGNRLKIDVGVIMLSLSVILISVAAVCALYRELGAQVPYKEYSMTWGMLRNAVREYTKIEDVFLYPYAALASPLATVAFCLALYGIFFKIFYKS